MAKASRTELEQAAERGSLMETALVWAIGEPGRIRKFAQGGYRVHLVPAKHHEGIVLVWLPGQSSKYPSAHTTQSFLGWNPSVGDSEYGTIRALQEQVRKAANTYMLAA